MAFIHTLKKLYKGEIWVLDGAKHVFLLILRIYFGLGFMDAGYGKLHNINATARYFEAALST